jgi:hypothetical protein
MDIVVILTILRALAAILGVTFMVLTFRAWRAHHSRRLAVLLLAVAMLTAAALAEGAALQVLGFSEDVAHLIEAVIGLAAFAVLLSSVLLRETQRVSERVQPPSLE